MTAKPYGLIYSQYGCQNITFGVAALKSTGEKISRWCRLAGQAEVFEQDADAEPGEDAGGDEESVAARRRVRAGEDESDDEHDHVGIEMQPLDGEQGHADHDQDYAR